MIARRAFDDRHRFSPIKHPLLRPTIDALAVPHRHTPSLTSNDLSALRPMPFRTENLLDEPTALAASAFSISRFSNHRNKRIKAALSRIRPRSIGGK
jgi:hypothetical protein